MSKARGMLAVSLMLAACGSKEESKVSKKRDRPPIVREEEMKLPDPAQPKAGSGGGNDVAIDDIPSPPQQNDLLPPHHGAGAGGPTGSRTQQPDPKPECVDEGPLVSWEPAKLRGCFDTNDDGEADRCVTWRRDGKVQLIDSVFTVEEPTGIEEKEPPVEFRSDEENNDDERITLDYNTVDICPYDRVCMKLMPKVGDGEVQHVLTDPDYKRAVLVIKDGEGQKGTYEMWDLASGRMRTRISMKRLVADEYYEFSARMGSGVVIALATDSNARTLGSIFGIEGGFRGEVAQGSRNLDVDKTFTHAGVFGIIDVGPIDSEKPYVLHLHSLSTGGALGKFTIKPDDGGAELLFHTLKNGFVGVTQWGTENVRIDMIDLKSRTNRLLFAPSC